MKKFLALNNELFSTEGLLTIRKATDMKGYKIVVMYSNQLVGFDVFYRNREEREKDFNNIKNLLTNENFLVINEELISTKNLRKVSMDNTERDYKINFTYDLDERKEFRTMPKEIINKTFSINVYYNNDKELRDKDFKYIKMKLL